MSDNNPYPVLKVRGGPLPADISVSLNDEPLMTVQALKLEAKVDGLATVSLTFFSEVDVSVQAEVLDNSTLSATSAGRPRTEEEGVDLTALTRPHLTRRWQEREATS